MGISCLESEVIVSCAVLYLPAAIAVGLHWTDPNQAAARPALLNQLGTGLSALLAAIYVFFTKELKAPEGGESSLGAWGVAMWSVAAGLNIIVAVAFAMLDADTSIDSFEWFLAPTTAITGAYVALFTALATTADDNNWPWVEELLSKLSNCGLSLPANLCACITDEDTPWFTSVSPEEAAAQARVKMAKETSAKVAEAKAASDAVDHALAMKERELEDTTLRLRSAKASQHLSSGAVGVPKPENSAETAAVLEGGVARGTIPLALKNIDILEQSVTKQNREKYVLTKLQSDAKAASDTAAGKAVKARLAAAAAVAAEATLSHLEAALESADKAHAERMKDTKAAKCGSWEVLCYPVIFVTASLLFLPAVLAIVASQNDASKDSGRMAFYNQILGQGATALLSIAGLYTSKYRNPPPPGFYTTIVAGIIWVFAAGFNLAAASLFVQRSAAYGDSAIWKCLVLAAAASTNGYVHLYTTASKLPLEIAMYRQLEQEADAQPLLSPPEQLSAAMGAADGEAKEPEGPPSHDGGFSGNGDDVMPI